MGLLELLFKDAVTKKQGAIKPIQLQTKRNIQMSNPSDAELKKKEEELLNRIRTGIKLSRKCRQEYKFSASRMVKLTKEGLLKLEEQIYATQNDTCQIKSLEKEPDDDFYRHYSLGQFVVSL